MQPSCATVYIGIVDCCQSLEMSLQQRLAYYEADASRYDERAVEATQAGYEEIASHLKKEAARFRVLCTMLTEGSQGFLAAATHPSLPCRFCSRL